MKYITISGIPLIVALMVMMSSLHCQHRAEIEILNNSKLWLNVWLDGGTCCEGATYKINPQEAQSHTIEPSKDFKCGRIWSERAFGTCCPHKAYVHWNWNAQKKKWGNRVIVDVPRSPGGDCENYVLIVNVDDEGKVQLNWQ